MGFGEITMTGRCPVCGSTVDRDARPCKRCSVRYHSECWTYAGGCAVYGCKPASPRGAAAIEDWEFPRSCAEIGRQLARTGATLTRDVVALALGSLLGLTFWDLMDAHGGIFFVLWFLLGLAYLLYWPFFRARGFAVTVMHAFFLGPLVHVVVPLEIPTLFALGSGLAMTALGLAALLHAWSPLLARCGLGLALLAVGVFYQSDGRSVWFQIDRSGPEQPLMTAPWPAEPVVLASPASMHAWRVGGQLERLHEIGATGYGTLDEARWATELGRRIAGLAASEPVLDPARAARSGPLFTRAELAALLRDPGAGSALGMGHARATEERLVIVPWWGDRAPEIADVVRGHGKLRVIVALPGTGTPFVGRPEATLGTRRFYRSVVAVPPEPEAVEIEYRAPGSWALGHRLALRLSGYEPDAVPPVAQAAPVELDADWMLRRLSPVLELFDGNGADR